MNKKYTGTELLYCTVEGMIEDGAQFICDQFKGLVFIYREDYLSDTHDDLSNYWIMENGVSIDGCLYDVVSGYNLDELVFKLHKPDKIKKFIKRLLCKHNYIDWSNMPGYQTFKCTKCGKEIKYSPYKGFFR